jgi:hypothetical protein
VSNLLRLGLVLGGYAVALAAAFAALAASALLAQDDPAQASGGMQAFGDLLLFVAVFCIVALVPTALALWFLRAVPTFWLVLSIVSLALAATGPIAAAMIQHMDRLAGALVAFLSLLRVLGAPLLAVGFAICALIAPTGRSRGALLAAAAIEGAVGAYMVLCLFVLGRWLI